MSDNILEAENLHLWRGDHHVLRGVSLSARGGEILQIVGANGAGKTSLLRTLATLLYPEEGSVRWNGANVRRDPRAFQGALTYLGHEPPLKGDLTGSENLRFWIGVRRRLGRSDLDAALGRVDAQGFRDRPVRTLSAGQRRRVALAGLLLSGSALWLLDEPTTNLDTDGQALVGRLIDEHVAAGGVAVAAVHHELAVRRGDVRHLELAA